jgi:hypothetical protein
MEGEHPVAEIVQCREKASGYADGMLAERLRVLRPESVDSVSVRDRGVGGSNPLAPTTFHFVPSRSDVRAFRLARLASRLDQILSPRPIKPSKACRNAGFFAVPAGGFSLAAHSVRPAGNSPLSAFGDENMPVSRGRAVRDSRRNLRETRIGMLTLCSVDWAKQRVSIPLSTGSRDHSDLRLHLRRPERTAGGGSGGGNQSWWRSAHFAWSFRTVATIRSVACGNHRGRS